MLLLKEKLILKKLFAMKRIVLILLLVSGFAYGTLHAQIRKVPAEVTNAFKAKFPDAQDVEWKAEISDFKVNFTLNGAEKETEYNSKGEWKETDTKMTYDSVPQDMKDG